MKHRAVAAVPEVCRDAQLVGLSQVSQQDPAVRAHPLRVQAAAVQGDLEHRVRLQFGVAVSSRPQAAEPDHRS